MNNLKVHIFRSKMEANFVRILNFHNVAWEYEKFRLILSSCSILIDFYLPNFNQYVEVKGYFGNGGDRLKKISLEKPKFPIKILDNEGYKILTKKYSKLISEWEF